MGTEAEHIGKVFAVQGQFGVRLILLQGLAGQGQHFRFIEGKRALRFHSGGQDLVAHTLVTRHGVVFVFFHRRVQVHAVDQPRKPFLKLQEGKKRIRPFAQTALKAGGLGNQPFDLRQVGLPNAFIRIQAVGIPFIFCGDFRTGW